jgi:hypothetical protein
MTDSIELIRLETPTHLADWQRHFGHLMAELRAAGRRVVGQSRDPTVLELLDAFQRGDADPVGFGLVEHLYEFAAFHVPGSTGRTMAECAVDAAHLLPEEVRGLLPRLAASYWDLFEVVGLTDSGALGLRRLHDNVSVELSALERDLPLMHHTVVACRRFDAGGFVAAPVPLMPEQEGLAQLVSQLECEQPGPFDTRADYMRYRGSALILAHAIRRHRDRLAGWRPMPEPSVSLVESELDAEAWRRLDAAFGLLEAAVADSLTGVAPLVLSLPDGGVCSIARNGPWPALTLFESMREQLEWQESGHASRFVRAWRARADELFGEDVELLESVGLQPEQDGAVVAVGLDGGVWEDVDATQVDRLVEACRWVALQVQSGGELAA